MSEKWKQIKNDVVQIVGPGVHAETICEAVNADVAAQIVREHNEFPRWVKCEDEMPPDGEHVHGWTKDRDIVCYLNKDWGIWHDANGGDEISAPTHWSKLLASPKD